MQQPHRERIRTVHLAFRIPEELAQRIDVLAEQAVDARVVTMAMRRTEMARALLTRAVEEAEARVRAEGEAKR